MHGVRFITVKWTEKKNVISTSLPQDILAIALFSHSLEDIENKNINDI